MPLKYINLKCINNYQQLTDKFAYNQDNQIISKFNSLFKQNSPIGQKCLTYL